MDNGTNKAKKEANIMYYKQLPESDMELYVIGRGHT